MDGMKMVGGDFYFEHSYVEKVMRGSRRDGFIVGWVVGMVSAGLIASAVAQQTAAPQQKPNFQILIEQQIGDLAVKGSICTANLDTMQATLAQRDKTISDLQAQLAEAKKEPPK